MVDLADGADRARGRARDGLALAVVVAVALTGGHPGTQVHVLAAVGLYALARVALARPPARASGCGGSGLVGGGARARRC